MIRVRVIAPQSGARANLERAVAQDPELELVATSGLLRVPDGTVGAPEADVIVLDTGPESHLPVPVFQEHLPDHAATAVVILLDDLELEVGARALRAGARAVLPRAASPEELRAAVRAAAAGLASLPAALALGLLDGTLHPGEHEPLEDGDGGLTPREREILALLGEGLVNKEIGVRLGISDHTVKTHLTAIYEKLDVSNRAEAVAQGLRRGLVML